MPLHLSRRRILPLLLAAPHAAQALARRFDVTSFGALPDGRTLATTALQRAIDAASAVGGGEVILPRGRFVSGTLLLKSGVTLVLDEGAELLGSADPADYTAVDPFVDGVGTPRGHTLIGAIDVERVGIAGSGTIDGRGGELAHLSAKTPGARPFLLRFVRSRTITVEGVRLRNSGAWTMHLFQCADARLARLDIRSLGLPNNDGIDVDSSSRITIEGCTIETGDDAICLKTTSTTSCREIRVTGCSLTSRCAAFKIGTESAGDFEDIHVSHCTVPEAGLAAIKLLSVDGAHLRRVTIEDIAIDRARTPIFLRLGARGKTFRSGDVARPTGSLSEVTLRRITVARASGIGMMLSGIPGAAIDGVTIEDLSVTLVEGAPAPAESLPELPASYPEITMFGAALPASGLFARHVRGLALTRVTLSTPAGDARPAVVCEDVAELALAHWKILASEGGASVAVLRAARGAKVEDIHLSGGHWANLLQVEGAGSERIHLEGPTPDGVEQPVRLSEGATSTAMSRR